MKVLLIAYAFPPYPIVGSIRAQQLADSFVGAGHQVQVVTSRLPGEASGSRLSEAGLEVEATTTWPHPKEFYRWAKRRLASDSSASAESQSQPRFVKEEAWSPPDRIPAWKRYILSLLHVPDEVQGFLLPSVVRGLQAFRKGPDLIYTTSPPPTVHLAGLCLKALTGAQWVAEFRDPWVGNADRAGGRVVHSQMADGINGWLERRCLKAADRIVTVTDQAGEMYEDRLGAEAGDKVLVVRNGIRAIEPPPPGPPKAPLKILYLGSLWGSRDPRPFLDGLQSVAEERRIDSSDIRVDFVGHCRFVGEIDLEAEAERRNLSGLVRFTGWVDAEAAADLLREADVLLLLAQGHPAQVPQKLYDYLGSGRPILALADARGESAALLRETGGHFIVTEEEDWDAAGAIAGALDGFREGVRFDGKAPDQNVLRKWTTRNQFENLLDALDLK